MQWTKTENRGTRRPIVTPGRIREKSTTRLRAAATSCGVTALFSVVAAVALPAHSVTLEVSDMSVDGVTISGGQLYVPVGGTVTIGSRVTAPPGEAVAGLGISYYGYDQTLIDATTTSVGGVVFADFCIAGLGEIGGLTPFPQGTPVVPTPAFFGALEGQQRVRVLSGYTFEPVEYLSMFATGIDGVCGGEDADFRVTFTALAEGTTTITIGTGDDLGGIVLLADGSVAQATNAAVGVTVVPEPGMAVALASGMLLLGRASRYRMRASMA